MPLNLERLLSWPFAEVRQDYTARDTMLYALSLGFGADPMDRRQLAYVFEEELQTLPSMSLVLGRPGAWYTDPLAGITWSHLVHGEQSFTVHRPLPAAGSVLARERVKSVIDKGSGKGALIYTERKITDAASGHLLATLESCMFCRADGGFDGPAGPVPTRVPIPDRSPDHVEVVSTLPSAALLYRLNGDTNPLHADPAFAAKAGFPRPILHGLCTLGLAARALTRVECEEAAARLQTLSVRFSAPFFPGETLAVDIWRESDEVRFTARSVERALKVLDGGRARIVSDAAFNRPGIGRGRTHTPMEI